MATISQKHNTGRRDKPKDTERQHHRIHNDANYQFAKYVKQAWNIRPPNDPRDQKPRDSQQTPRGDRRFCTQGNSPSHNVTLKYSRIFADQVKIPPPKDRYCLIKDTVLLHFHSAHASITRAARRHGAATGCQHGRANGGLRLDGHHCALSLQIDLAPRTVTVETAPHGAAVAMTRQVKPAL